MIAYRFFRGIFRIAIRTFFSSIEVEGIANVPGSGPVILVPNHTNALVDGLVVGCCLKRPVTLTAKTTLAGNPVLRWMMQAAGVITVQRRQDAKQQSDMRANELAFGQIRDVLESGGAVCLFPEGKSYSEPSVQKFHTGAARIALSFLAESRLPEALLMVPVGLHFEKKSVFRSRAWVGFGAPVNALQWSLDYPGEDAADLTRLLEQRVRALVMDFDARERSELFRGAAELLATHGEAPRELGLSAPAELSEQLRLVHALQEGNEQLRRTLPDRLIALEDRLRRHLAELDYHAVAPREVFLKMHSGRAAFFVLRELELVLLGGPIALWGLLNHLPPLAAVRALAGRITHEEDQYATNVIFISVIVFPLFYILLIALAAHFLSPGWLLLYLISVLYAGAYSITWFDRVRGAFRRSRSYLLWRRRPELQQSLVEDGRDIISEIRRLGDLLEANHGNPA